MPEDRTPLREALREPEMKREENGITGDGADLVEAVTPAGLSGVLPVGWTAIVQTRSRPLPMRWRRCYEERPVKPESELLLIERA